jgi:DNA repair exonuclease SbcCD ATPase subunit
MDPATVLGVAAAIVQFVEIGLKTLALCKQIRDTDTDATLLHAELQQTTKQLETIQSLVTLDSFPRDTSRSIKQCSQDCSSTAKELQDLLSEIRAIAQKKRFGVARAAFRAMKDQKKVEKIQNKLEKCQARFQTAVSVDTREQVLALLKTPGHLSQTLEDVVYPELKRMHNSTHCPDF